MATKKPSTDKTLTVKVSVTKRNITEGTCRDSEKCAVAQALVDTGMFKAVTVGATTATGKQGRRRYKGILPVKVQDFIRNFDRDKTSVKPFRFTLKFTY